ncbi:MAG: ATP synthase F1 subunit gamma [Bacteroidetes bacterium]|nr:ATP synthase F1 subunit gamma [Bacteroidota bacterium]HET6245721.1 ATP synthase F1 subunit gamma [Bacteroidia bacterium]
MANLKEVRSRITSVSSTQQITSAMKMVSAAKLRRAQDAITQMRPYASKLKEILENLSSTLESSADNPYSKQRTVKNVLIVVVTSNRGLCGAFNANVVKQASKLASETYANSNVSVLCVGKKATDYFKKSKYNIIGSDMPRRLHELFDDLSFANVFPIAEVIMELFVKGEFDRIELVYNQFKNAAIQVLTTEQFLPIKPLEVSASGSSFTSEYIFEPNKESIVSELIPKSLKIQFYKALLDSHAAEHGARMTAMHKATDNAGELLKSLRLTYNKARQAAITNEILEIVGGAEALKS